MRKIESTTFRDLRQSAGLNPTEASEILGVSERTLLRWESGKSKTPLSAVKLLEAILLQRKKKPTKTKFTFIDLFAGIGGMRMAFESVKGECVFTSEWNKFAQQTYRANFDTIGHPFNGDITTANAEDIPEHDVLLAGFPCQPFSIAGVSKKKSLDRPHGFLCETQGTLFFDVARIIDYHRPKAFLLENVKNLASHDRGKTFNVIKKTLEEELNYNISYKVVDAKGYLPQHRERIFIVGFRDSSDFDINSIKFKDPEKGPKLKSILHPLTGEEKPEFPYTDDNGLVAEKYTLTPKLWSYLQAYAAKHKAKGNGFGFGLTDHNGTARTLSARYYKDGSEILIKREEGNPRRLTPRECARLMGFDKGNGASFKIPVSDTQAYRQFGNSVAVPVVKHIAKEMIAFLVEKEQQLVSEQSLAAEV